MTCNNCGGKMVGDGYTTVFHCEEAAEVLYRDKEPDAKPVACRREPPSSDYKHGIERGLSRARDIVTDLCRCAGPGGCVHDDVVRSITDEHGWAYCPDCKTNKPFVMTHYRADHLCQRALDLEQAVCDAERMLGAQEPPLRSLAWLDAVVKARQLSSALDIAREEWKSRGATK